MVDRICEQCGTAFPAKRRSARFCSDACRTAHHQPAVEPVPEIRTDPQAVFRRLMKRLGLPNPKRPSGLTWERLDAVTHRLQKGIYVTDPSPTENPSWHAIWSALLHGKRKRHTVSVGPEVLEAYRLQPDLPHAKMVAETLLTGNIEKPVLAAHEDDDCTEMMERDVRAFSGLLGKRKPR